ncbi:hypothetical protein CDL15_Pgr010063 [Punica granatum]|uniref:Uncharacterized protein n=1 Tax=Punica granatum TaxID=22663 RepID=A0A218X4D1_PUNGR|nr:hypothetical protein CDL15_Pgr010063 [Punica granatum]
MYSYGEVDGSFLPHCLQRLPFVWNSFGNIATKLDFAPMVLDPLLAVQTTNDRLQAYQEAWYSKLSLSEATCKLRCSSDQLHFSVLALLPQPQAHGLVLLQSTLKPLFLVHAWAFKGSTGDSLQGELFCCKKKPLNVH